MSELARDEAKRSEMVAAMRSFKFETLDLSLITDDTLVIGRKRDPQFYALRGILIATGMGGFLVSLGMYLLATGAFGRRGSPPDPWFVANFWPCFAVLLVLAGLVAWGVAVGSRFEVKRWSKIFASNNLTEISSGSYLQGDTSHWSGVLHGCRLGPAASNVTFGTYDGWLGHHAGPNEQGNLKLTESLFINIYIPELSGEIKYFSPANALQRDDLPPMNDAAWEACRYLASKYTLTVGLGNISVSMAAGTNNSFETSLLGGLDLPSKWRLVANLISKQLATIVEGLEV